MHAASLVLYCKSYRTDLRRVARLARSIQKFNVENIPFYVSVPERDFELFFTSLQHLDAIVIQDEFILSKNSKINALQLSSLPGHISQQIIKAEFWRLNLATSYMCIDSDAIFIRPFRHADYLAVNDVPYTIVDEGHEFLGSAIATGKMHLVENFLNEAQRVSILFLRKGKTYSFGPFPVLWHRAVWESLDMQYLQPNQMNLLDAILKIPVESHWYGEALLRYQAIPLISCQPLFKVYHYAWQLDQERHAGVDNEKLAKLYSGVIFQSAWEREMDWPTEGGNQLSRLGRRFRRKLGRI